DELMGAFVRTTIRQDTGDVVAAKNIEHALERIIRIGLLIVVQMRVKDFQRLLRTPRKMVTAMTAAAVARAIIPDARMANPSIRSADERRPDPTACCRTAGALGQE